MKNLYFIILIGSIMLASLALFTGCSDDDNPVIDTNLPPVISSLTASKDTVDFSDTCTIICSASDPDGDTLIYNWSPDAGSINGTGSSITWTSPNVGGASIVVCEVSDEHGEAVTDSISLMVVRDSVWQIVFEDNFDGDILNTSNWTQIDSTPAPYSLTGSGEFEIEGEIGNNGATFVYNTAVSDNYVRVTTKFRTTQKDPVHDNVDMVIVLNSNSASDGFYFDDSFYYVMLTSEPFENTRDYEVQIIKFTNGVHTMLRAESMGGTMPQISANNDYILVGANSNGTITCTVKDENGIVLKSVSVQDSSYSGGKIGIGGDMNIDAIFPQSVFFDYVIVEKYQ